MSTPTTSRPAVPHEPLPQAGQSLRNQIDTIRDDRMLQWIVIFLAVLAMAITEWINLLFHVPRSITAALIPTFAALVVGIIAFRKCRSALRDIRILSQGERAERHIAKYLDDSCIPLGYKVFHDIPCTSNTGNDDFNIDHLLIGPAGIFTLETKNWSKPPDGTLSDFSWTAYDSSGTATASGGFYADGYGSLPVSSPGLYTVKVTSSKFPWFQRSVQFFLAKLKILWNGADITDAAGNVVVHNGDDISNTTVDYLAGQRISLRYEFGYPTGTIQKTKWNLGSLANIVKGYDASNSIGAVSKLTASDFGAADITFFDVGNAPNQPFSVTLTWKFGAQIIAFSASTTFNVKKPGVGNYTPPNTFTVTMQQYAGEINPTEIKDHVVWSTAVLGTTKGTIQWVQLIKSRRTIVDIFGLSHTHWDTGPSFALDTRYPYVEPGIPTASDDPYEPITWRTWEIAIQDSFRDWLMWTPPGGDSIPVPIQTWSWQWMGVYDVLAGSFVRPAGAPGSFTTINGVNTDVFPQWNSGIG